MAFRLISCFYSSVCAILYSQENIDRHYIRKLRIFVVLIMWGNYNHGVIHDKVKNTASKVYTVNNLVLFLFGTLSLSRPLGFTLHFL